MSAGRRLNRGEVIEKLRQLLADFPEVVFAVLFGSLATKGFSVHDVDIAVKVEAEDKYVILAKLVEEASEVLGVEGGIDLVDLDRADPMLKARVLVEGIVIIDRRGFRGELLRELNQVPLEYWEYAALSLEEWLKSDNPMPIDAGIVKARIDFIKSEIDFLEEYVMSKGVAEVESSPILRRLLERGYQLIVEALIDVCRHIASAKGWRTAGTAKDYILECAKHGVIQTALAEELTRHTTLRNIIIHRYLAIDYEKLYEEAQKLLKHVAEFEKYIREFIRKELKHTI
jgi:uncharacterized protein YutE (UPF0331/DUF86 family)/predicted nucleotidyltransferase